MDMPTPAVMPIQPDSPNPNRFFFLDRLSNCINYLNTQYLVLLRSASSENALDAAHDGAIDPRGKFYCHNVTSVVVNH